MEGNNLIAYYFNTSENYCHKNSQQQKTESECWEGGGGWGKEGSKLKIELWRLFVFEWRCATSESKKIKFQVSRSFGANLLNCVFNWIKFE